MRKLVGAVALLAATAGSAAADDPKFVYGNKDDVKNVKAVEWRATAEGGLLLTTGNSETTSATGGLHVSRKEGNNQLAIEGSAAYAKASLRTGEDLNGNGLIDGPDEIVETDTITAETLFGKARYDRFLTNDNSLFVAALASRDVPAGKLSVFGGQLGYSRQLYKSDTSLTVAELGYDFSREHLVKGSPIAIHSARVFVGHHAKLAEGTLLDASVEVLTNLNHETLPTMQDGSAFMDTRVNMRVAISAKLGKNLAFQTSFEAHYDNRPAPLAIKNLAPGFVPAAEPLDAIMKAQLIYTFAGADEPPKKS